MRVLLSPGVAAAVSQLPQALYPLAPGFSDRLPPLTDRLRSPCHSQSGQADRWRGAIIGEGDPGGIRSGIAYDLNERPSSFYPLMLLTALITLWDNSVYALDRP